MSPEQEQAAADALPDVLDLLERGIPLMRELRSRDTKSLNVVEAKSFVWEGAASDLLAKIKEPHA